jgi:hypothetical protein
MNDEDLRDLFAGLAMQGILHTASIGYNSSRVAQLAYKLADAMIEAKYHKELPEEGIASVVKKRKTKLT